MIKWNNLEGKKIRDKGKGVDRYFVEKAIGSGGAGKVYLAKDLTNDNYVAIKTSNPNQTMSNSHLRFEIEAKILSKLNHPNIVKFYDYFSQDNVEMIVMEYVEGDSLEKKLSKDKLINLDDSLKYVKQILSALNEIHSHKVYHRDIKTDNIQLTPDGKVKLLDFGIVQETIDQDLTRQGSVIGTISYLAPEIIRDPHKKANARTDLYSVGIMLYQLLTGFKPFNADSGLYGPEKNNNLAQKIVFEEVLTPREHDATIPEEVSHFVMKLIEKDPSNRYQTTNDAIKDLQKIINGEPITTLQGYYGNEKEYSTKKQIIILSSITSVILIILIIVMVIIFI